MRDRLNDSWPTLVEELPVRILEKLRAAGHIVTLSEGQQLHARGDTNRGLTLVEEGSLSLSTVMEDGQILLTAIIGPGQQIGEFTIFTDLPRTHDVFAASDARVLQVPVQQLEPLMAEEPTLVRALLVSNVRRLHSVAEILHDFRASPAVMRLAKTLLLMNRTAQEPGRLHCSQEDLAFFLGVSRSWVNKALAELQQMGLVRQGYGVLVLEDAARLETWLADQMQYEFLPGSR